jgi:hypothetical protein
MRRLAGISLLLALGTRAAHAQQEPHDVHATRAMATSSAMPGRMPASSATMRLVANDSEVVVVLGPIVLPAHAEHHAVPQPPPLTRAFGADGWLHGYTVELVDERGRPIPRELLHHMNLIIPDKRELFSDIMLRLAAAGSETGPVELPGLLGYRIHPADSVLVSAMFHNPTARSYVATLRVRMPFKRADSMIGAIGFYPFYLDVMPPAGSHSFDLPAGRSERYWEGRPAIDGRVLGVGGHVHRYGTALRLEDRTARRVLWEASPTTDSTGEIVSVPTARFIARLGIPMHRDHVYRFTVTYDNPTGHPIADGGMGALGGVFVPARGARWPAIDRTSAEYAEDVRLTYRVGR